MIRSSSSSFFKARHRERERENTFQKTRRRRRRRGKSGLYPNNHLHPTRVPKLLSIFCLALPGWVFNFGVEREKTNSITTTTTPPSNLYIYIQYIYRSISTLLCAPRNEAPCFCIEESERSLISTPLLCSCVLYKKWSHIDLFHPQKNLKFVNHLFIGSSLDSFYWKEIKFWIRDLSISVWRWRRMGDGSLKKSKVFFFLHLWLLTIKIMLSQ